MDYAQIGGWKKENEQVFWGELAPCDHMVQIYEDDEAFIKLLSAYVIGGIRAGETVIVIATTPHLLSLNERIRNANFDPFHLKVKDKYMPFDAEELLSKFMIDGWPDESLFMHTVSNLLLRAKRNGTHIRAFGEMVAILWAKGLTGATVQLEHLWNTFMETNKFSLLCAYPKSGFTGNPEDSIRHICATHSKVVSKYPADTNEILYQDVEKSSTR